jgi:hypothetical protein
LGGRQDAVYMVALIFWDCVRSQFIRWPQYFGILNMNLASCHPLSTLDFEIDHIFLKTLCTPEFNCKLGEQL